MNDGTLLGSALEELLRWEASISVSAVSTYVWETVHLVRLQQPDVVVFLGAAVDDAFAGLVEDVRRAHPAARIAALNSEEGAPVVPGVDIALSCEISYPVFLESLRGRDSSESRELSPREVEVVGLASRGLSNHQIARSLDIAEGTVKRHMRGVFDKLGAHSRVDAVNKAMERRLIRPPVAAPVP